MKSSWTSPDDTMNGSRLSALMIHHHDLIVGYGGPIGREYWLTRYDLDGDKKLQRFTPHEELDSWRTVQWNREDQYIFKGHAEQLAKMVKAGGRVGLGSHGEVLDRNPLTDIKNSNSIKYVMKNGRLYDGNTLEEGKPAGEEVAVAPYSRICSLTPGGLAEKEAMR